jgi:hypothetical protein
MLVPGDSWKIEPASFTWKNAWRDCYIWFGDACDKSGTDVRCRPRTARRHCPAASALLRTKGGDEPCSSRTTQRSGIRARWRAGGPDGDADSCVRPPLPPGGPLGGRDFTGRVFATTSLCGVLRAAGDRGGLGPRWRGSPPARIPRPASAPLAQVIAVPLRNLAKLSVPPPGWRGRHLPMKPCPRHRGGALVTAYGGPLP